MSQSPELLKTIYNDLAELPVYTAAQFLAKNGNMDEANQKSHH